MLAASLLLLALAAPADPAFDPGPNPLLMRHPTLSKTTIAFQFAGDIWTVPRSGGEATRLTAAPGLNSSPFFSPDGSMIAFSGQYDGNVDVFVVPAVGGVPKRLTAHPAPDEVEGWTPDGKSVVFSSSMLSNTDHPRLFTVPVTGGFPKALPFPAGVEVCFSPDGKRIAYTAHQMWEQAWKRYRGGQTRSIFIGDLADSHVKLVPRQNTDDHNPMWMGDSIYYLSDRRGPVGLDRYDTKSGSVTEVIKGEGFDLKSACAGPDAIVYERLGSINLFDPATKTSRRVDISIHGDFPEVRPAIKDLHDRIGSVGISPTGQRAVLAARGWIFTAPVKKGDVRMLDGNQGVYRRDPAWSPDGKTIAFITDEGGHQQMALVDLAANKERHLPLGDPPAYYGQPTWSPDSKLIAYTDNRLGLWSLDVASGKNTKIDSGTYRGASEIDPRWSPDSKWLTWNRDLDSHVDAVFVHSFDTGKNTQITDGLAYATSPCFDRNGKYLYFLASTDVGQGTDFEDLSSLNAPNNTTSVYAVVLRIDLPNPLEPESDEEVIKEEKKEEKKDEKKPDDKPAPVGIDLAGIEQRIIALPIPTSGYRTVEAGPADSLFVLSFPPRASATSVGGPSKLEQFKFSDRKVTHFADGVSGFQVCADGSKLLLSARGGNQIVSSASPPPPGDGSVDLSQVRAKIDPRAEWDSMYHDTWATERMLFYDPNLHGIDSVAMEHRYEPFLKNICSRDDLNYLFTDMLGEICVGHMFIGGGDLPDSKHIQGGLLGADFAFDQSRYRLTRIYDGERWNPRLYAPLAQPGINAKVGEYVLAIDGHDLTDSTDLYEALEGKAGKQVKVKIGPTPDGKGSREVTVVPVASESNLRFRAWTEDNRRYVEKATHGRGGYVHVPDTSVGGWQEFNRYYYTQADKQGMIVDDRFNHGGYINDFMVREMEKPLDFGSTTRYGKDIKIPVAAVYGPKVMLINEMAGSGGDIFPFLFRQHKVGKLVGKRTWGAMLSAYGFELVDGGSIRAPDDAMFNPQTGNWIIENEGTPPDIDVDLDPFLWRQGRDAQMEAAVAELNKEMDARGPVNMKHPVYPNKTKLKN